MELLTQKIVAGLGVISASAAIFAVGYSLGKDTNEGTVSFVRERLEVAEKTEVRLQAENVSLKLELLNSKSASPNAGSVVGATNVGASSPAIAPSTTEKAAPHAEQVILGNGQTAVLFEGKVNVSLVAVAFEGSPLRHKVIASVGATGKEGKLIDKADVGYALTYEGYEIRVVATDTLSATFRVTVLPR